MTPVSPQYIYPCFLLVGMNATPAAMKAVERWRDKGYDESTIWNGFASQSFRYIENAFSIPTTCAYSAPPELAHQMQYLIKEMLAGVNIAQLVNDHSGVDGGCVLNLSGRPWKLGLAVEPFAF